MVISLHTTGSPVSRAERKNINENWERIIDGLTRLQTQINVLAGGKEVDDLLKSIQDAIDNAYSSVNKAIDENNAATQEAINNFNTSLELALSSISNALQVTETAITNANQATVDAKNATSDANTAVKTINEKFVEATQVIDSLNALKIQLEQMEQQLETAQSDVEIATANANNATQSAVDATNTMVAKMDEADTAIANANNAANTANQATEAIKGWGTATVWNSTTTYEKNNVVTDNGSTWQALRQNTNTKPVEGLDWTCLARKGVDGTGSVGSVNGQYPDETGNVTLDLGQGTVKKVNGKDPDGTGEVVLTASDLGAFSGSLLENGSVIMKKLSQEVQDAIANASGGGNSYFMPYTLATTEEGQKTWGLPANSYDAATDSLLVFYNASLLDSALWNVTGDAGTGYKVNIPDAPIARILDNNVTVVVLKNGINGSPEEISGTLLTNASVGLQKLGQDVLDIIGNTGRSLKFSALSYDLPTTEENQKSWSIPIKSYDKDNDFVIVFHNGSHLSPASWEITEDAFKDYDLNISDNPITNIADNNVRIIIFKNVPTDGTERFSGILLEDGTVTIEKLDREVQDAISKADGKVEIINNLTDGGIDKVLSSEMGKELKKQVDENSKTVTTLQQEVTDNKSEVTAHLAEIATTEKLGHVKVGKNLTISTDGTLDAQAGNNNEPILYNDDLNNLTEYGTYFVPANALNAPATGNDMNVFVSGTIDKLDIMQIVTFPRSATSGIMLKRVGKRANISSSVTWSTNSQQPAINGWQQINVWVSDSMSSDSVTSAASSSAVKKLNDSKANKAQESEINAALQNGWAGNAKFYKDEFGIVQFFCVIYGGTTAAGTRLFQFPVGYRPIITRVMPVITYTGIDVSDTATHLTIDSAGLVQLAYASKTNIAASFSFRV